MEKTMYDKYMEDCRKVFDLQYAMQIYASFDPSNFSMRKDEMERLKSLPYEQPQKEVMPSIISMDYKSSFAEKEAQEQKTRHEQNIEILSLEHQQRLELEKARIVRAAFDEKATEAMQAIISMRKDFKEINMSESDIEKNQRYAAIYWCHQQAALLPANAYVWRVDESQNVLKSLDITANYLFKTFFPDLAQNEKE
jgi:hypothetical protein